MKADGFADLPVDFLAGDHGVRGGSVTDAGHSDVNLGGLGLGAAGGVGEIVEKLGSGLGSRYEQVVTGAGAGDIEKMALGVVDLV